MSEAVNILFLDFISEKRCGLVKALREAKFNVSCPLSGEKDDDVVERPSIILCRMDRADDAGKHHGVIAGYRGDAAIPVAVVSSESDPSFYLDGMRYGISDYILLPCSIFYLSATIRGIINGHAGGVPRAADDVVINGGYGDLRINRESLARSFHSFMDNSLHQNSLVHDFLHHRSMIQYMRKDADVFTPPESGYADPDTREKEMRSALERKEFELFYQPVMSLRNDSLYSFETLIRWRHPEKGIIMPDEFIRTAEESPIIIPLGYWIVEESARQLADWCSRGLCSGLRLNVNLSAKQFVQPDLAERIIAIVGSLGVDSSSLGFEITESVFMDDMETANMNLLKLKSHGFRLYMDDFGTGYASLSYLLHFPVDVIKIDKSFVQWMHIDEQSEEIVRSVIALAHNLKREVVAEGVEIPEHVEMLKRFECDFIQGFLVAKPLDAGEAGDFIKRHITHK